MFAPKFWSKEISGQRKAEIGQRIKNGVMRRRWKYWKQKPNCIHMLVCIPPYLSIAQFVEYLKGKSSLMIFDRHANPKYKYGNRHFWGRGYDVDTVGRNERAIKEYIKNQLEKDYTKDQMTLKEYIDSFTGSKNK